jgi:hypothetical protein
LKSFLGRGEQKQEKQQGTSLTVERPHIMVQSGHEFCVYITSILVSKFGHTHFYAELMIREWEGGLKPILHSEQRERKLGRPRTPKRTWVGQRKWGANRLGFGKLLACIGFLCFFFFSLSLFFYSYIEEGQKSEKKIRYCSHLPLR